MKLFKIGLVTAIAGILPSCSDHFEANQPFYVLRTLPVTEINAQGAQFNAEIVKRGTEPVVDYGFILQQKNKPDTIRLSLGREIPQNISLRDTTNLIHTLVYAVKAYVQSENTIAYANPVVFTSLSSSHPVISSLSRDEVLDRDTLTIYGSSLKSGADFVTILGIQAQILEKESTRIKVITPVMNTGGQQTVYVHTLVGLAGHSITVSNPSITSISPDHGSTNTLVIIKGRFSYDSSLNLVTFGGLTAPIQEEIGNNTLEVRVPAGVSGNVSVAVSVSGKTSPSSKVFNIQ